MSVLTATSRADPAFPPPHFWVWERRKHLWVEICADSVEHYI